MKGHALISSDGLYRYSLRRWWNADKGFVMFVMLNPSTADADINDPTIRRCIGFARSWGYGGIVVCNLCAYRSTDPKGLLLAADPVGNGNRKIVERYLSNDGDDINRVKVDKIVLAWGNDVVLKKIIPDARIRELMDFLWSHPLSHVLDVTKHGTPKHPLYLPGSLEPRKILSDEN